MKVLYFRLPIIESNYYNYVKFLLNKEIFVSMLNIVNRQRNKTKLNHQYFENIDDENKAYWLGFLTADGSIGNSRGGLSIEVTLKEDDKSHLIKFCNSIDFYREPKIYKTNYGTNCARVIFNSEIMVNSLNKLGLYKDKSFSATPQTLKEELQRHYWRGLIDGDGSITIAAPHGFKALRINYLGTKSLGDAFSNLSLQVTGFKPKVSQVKSSPTTYLTVLCGSNALSMARYIYLDASVYLNRKYEIYLNALNEIPCLLLRKNYLDEYLQEKKMSLTDMCRLLGLHIANLHMIYDHKRYATKSMIRSISNFTGIKYENLITEGDIL